MLLPALALSACGEEPAPTPTPTATATPEPVATIAPADETLFKTLFAETCPAAKPVTAAFCKRAMGADTASCEYSLNEDAVMREKAELSIAEENWVIVDPETVCSQ